MRAISRFTCAGVVLALALAPSVEALPQLRLRDWVVSALDTVKYWVNLTEPAPDAALMRRDADRDGDGTVTVGEQASYEERLRASLQENLTASQANLDAVQPLNQRVRSAHTRGLAGSTNSAESLDLDVSYLLAYPAPTALDRHSFYRLVRSEDKGPVRVTVPPGFIAVDGTGIEAFSVSNDGRTVSGQNPGSGTLDVRFMERSRATAGYSDRPVGGGRHADGLVDRIPELGALGVLAALFLAAIHAGRRLT